MSDENHPWYGKRFVVSFRRKNSALPEDSYFFYKHHAEILWTYREMQGDEYITLSRIDPHGARTLVKELIR